MGSLGDIVHALPAAASLKRAFPEAEIDWLVERQWVPLLAHNPHLARLQVVETRAWRKHPARTATWRALAASLSALRGRRYDCALDFQGLIKSAALARLTGAPKVIGFHRHDLREPLAFFFYTATAAPIRPGGSGGLPAPAPHIVEQYLALAAVAGAREPVHEFCCQASEEDEQRFSQWRQASGAGPGRYVVLSPGAGWEAKRWPEECFAELADLLAGETRCAVVINCGPGDEALAGRVLGAARLARPLLCQPALGELIALVSHASLVVAGDTGPLHLAAACGAPVVGIFGPTDPLRNGPYGLRSRVVRAPNACTTYARNAGREAIRAVPVDAVFSAARDLLEVSQ